MEEPPERILSDNQAQTRREGSIARWKILTRSKKGTFKLDTFTLPIESSGQRVMKKVNYVGRANKLPQRMGLRRPAVYIATVSSLSTPNSEAQLPQEVIVSTMSFHPALTSAFRYPHLVAHVPNFASTFAQFLEASLLGNDLVMQKGLLIKWNVDVFIFLVFSILAVMASLILGLAVGLASRRADIGISLAGCLFTVIQIFQVISLWAFNG